MATPSGCPPPPVPTQEEKISGAAQLLKAAGIRACGTTSDTFIAQGNVSTLFANASVNINVQNTTTIGCENVVAIAKKYKDVIQNVNCIVNRAVTNVSNQTITVQSIIIQAENYSEIRIDCAGGQFGIGQSMVVKNVTDITLTNQDKSEIQQQVETLTNDIKETLQTNASGVGGSEKGNKYLEDLNKELQKITYNGKVNESLNNVSVRQDSNQNLVFLAKNYSKIWISGSECKIDQDMSIDIFSKLLVGNLVGNAFKDVVSVVNNFENVLKQESEGKGIEEVANSFWKTIKLGEVAGYLVLAAIVLGGGYLLVKLLTNPNAGKNIRELKSLKK